jgi:hypothetical protein
MAVIFKNMAAQFIFDCHSGRTGDGNCFKMKQSKKHLRHSFPAEFNHRMTHPFPQPAGKSVVNSLDSFFMRHDGLFFWLIFSRNNKLRSCKLCKNECHHGWHFFRLPRQHCSFSEQSEKNFPAQWPAS